MQIRHFVLTQEGFIREFSTEEAASVAAGAERLPEFADRRLRYLQVTVHNENANELKIQTAGASIQFDGDGKMLKAGPPVDEEPITRFEHDAVVQWAIRDIPTVAPVFH